MLSALKNTLSAIDRDSDASRVGYLDGWRGCAILLVLISHFLLVNEVELGRMGVDIFFVLSGMLMSHILFVKKTPLSTFYKRRFSRIFPIFFIYITLLCGLSYLFSLSDEHQNYLYHLTFLRAYFPDSVEMWRTGLPMGHLWSLNVEEHAYVLLSVLTILPLIKKYPYIPMFALGIASIGLQFFYVYHPQYTPHNMGQRTEIVIGFILISAGYYLIKHHVVKYVPAWLPILTLTVAVVCYTDYRPHWSLQWSLAPFLMAFTINHLDLTYAWFKQLLSYTPLRLIGIWSFSIYLWQQPLYFYSVAGDAHASLLGLIMMILSIIVGAISFYLIENPAREYINKHW